MPNIELALVPPVEVNDVAVVIDVLRMTTTAATLFARGLDELVVVAEEDKARALAIATGGMVIGERGGVAGAGFHGGNSPLEYLERDFSGANVILCTTNGSKAVEAAGSARELLLGSIVNSSAVARVAHALASRSVTLICAGTNGRPSLDDVVGAATIIRELTRLSPEWTLSDLARMALLLLDSPIGLSDLLWQSGHAATLNHIGFGSDVDFAAKLDLFSVVARKTASSPTRFAACRIDELGVMLEGSSAHRTRGAETA